VAGNKTFLTAKAPSVEAPWILNVRSLHRDVSRAASQARSLLKPYPDELMDAHDVSPIVNSAKYDGPDCIHPVSDDEIPQAGQLSLL
jgi:hypothetical protein